MSTFRRSGSVLLLAAAAFATMTGVAAAAAARTNVLFLIVDDLTAALGCHGARDARTPHMDALAARGVRFDQAFTQFALCNPSRASFLTGCYPERTRVFDLTTSLRDAMPDAVTLPQLFKNAGYAAGRVGKVFHVPDPTTTLDVELGAALHKDGAILDEAKLAERSEGDLSDPPRKSGREGNQYNRCYAASDRPDRDFTDHDIADNAIATLDQFKDKPFFLAVGFIRPHTPYVAPRSFFDRIDPKAVAMPAFYGPGGEDVSLIPKAALRPNNNVFRFAAPSPTEAREARRAYLASTSFVDAQVGRVLAKLDELKLADRTVVLLTGDHGYQLGEHGLWAKQTLFEEGTRVPMLVAAPGVTPGVCSQLVEQVDIYPTLAGLAGLDVPPYVQGRSMQPFLADPSTKGRPAVFSTMVSTHTKLTGRAVRTDRFRYIEWDEGRGGRQLYDHASDPHELRNLAAEPAQSDRVERMRARLSAHVAQRSGAAPPAAARPNVLIMVADDLGWADLGCQGCADVPTPHIDSIARNGVRFTSGYVSAPVCSPSRAGLLTGRFQTRFGHEVNLPGADRATVGLPLTETLAAQRFKAAGHATGHIGKWHLGNPHTPQYSPVSRGFDTSVWFPGQKKLPTLTLHRNGVAEKAEDRYVDEAIAREAAGFIATNAAAPWFLYVAFLTPHQPLDTPPGTEEPFTSIEGKERRSFAAMMTLLDGSVGRVLAAVRDGGQEERTLVVFFSDNGAPPKNGSRNTPLRGGKGTTWEGGVRVPWVMQWKGVLPAGRVVDAPVMTVDLLPTALAAAGAAVPAEAKFDGVNLLPFLTGRTDKPPHEALFWRYGQQMAVRAGDWKLVRAMDAKVTPPALATGLFNLVADPGEMTDLSSREPERVKGLQALWDVWDAGNVPPLWGDKE
jgi:arylsulfatase A-like enzyme